MKCIDWVNIYFEKQKKKAAAAVKKVRPRGNGLNLLDLIDNEEQLYAQAREAFTAGEGVGTAGTINTDLPGGAASTSEGKALPATKVSFKQIIEISSPRDLERATLAEAGSPRTSSVPLPSHTPLRTRASFFSLAADDADDADEEEEEADEEKAKGPGSAKASAWSSSLDDKGEGVKEKKRGPLLIGNFHAGHFVGHAALMNDAPHDFSVVATSACTTFVLTKATLYKLIHSEAEIGIMLQEALGCAIAAQAQELGQSHRRHNRADFLRDLKEKVIDMHSKSIPVSVREKYTSASNTVAKDAMAVVNRVAFSEGDFSKDAKGLSFKKARKSAKMKPSVASIKSPSAKNKNVRSIRRYLPLLGGDNKICPIEESEQDSAAKAALPGYNSALVQRRKEVEALRKLKKLDHLLNEETVLYNSEEEEDHHAKKVQAVSHMQALVRFNQQMQLRTATETPKQKLQRLLRRALRQYRRNKTRKELIATTESLNDLVGLETHDLFHRHSLALGVGHEHQEPIQHSEPQQASMSDLLAANVGSAPPRLTIAGSLAAGPDNHQRQVEEKASRPSAIFPMRYGIHSVSFGLSAIAALHLSHKSELTRHEMAKIKRRVRRGRNWSFSALEGQVQPLSSVELQPFGELGGVLSPRDETVSHCISRQVVRKVRRQSFPSLDNETWRDAKTFFAVL